MHLQLENTLFLFSLWLHQSLHISDNLTQRLRVGKVATLSHCIWISCNPLALLWLSGGSWAEKEPAEQGRGILPGFGLEVSWNGSAFLGEIFSSPCRETFFSCPNSEKLQGRLFFVFHREGGSFRGMTKQREGGKSCMGVPSKSPPPPLCCFPPLE